MKDNAVLAVIKRSGLRYQIFCVVVFLFFGSKENAVLYYYYYYYYYRQIHFKTTLLTGFRMIIIHEERRNRNVKISILLGMNRLHFFFHFQALVLIGVCF